VRACVWQEYKSTACRPLAAPLFTNHGSVMLKPRKYAQPLMHVAKSTHASMRVKQSVRSAIKRGRLGRESTADTNGARLREYVKKLDVVCAAAI